MPWHEGVEHDEPLFLGNDIFFIASSDCKFHGSVEPTFLFKGFCTRMPFTFISIVKDF